MLVWVVGIWLGGTMFMWWVATGNFRVVGDIHKSQNAGWQKITAELSDAERLEALRFQASVANRHFFHGWGVAQIFIAALAMFLVLRSGSGNLAMALVGAMLLICLALQLYVVPESIRLGEKMDFLPSGTENDDTAQFWLLHHTYTGLDMTKVVLGLVLSWLELRQVPAKPGSGREAAG